MINYHIFTILLFSLGIMGVLKNRKNILLLLLSAELIFLAICSNFLYFSRYWQDLSGQIFVLFILVAVAVKTAVGLIMLMVLYKKWRIY